MVPAFVILTIQQASFVNARIPSSKTTASWQSIKVSHPHVERMFGYVPTEPDKSFPVYSSFPRSNNVPSVTSREGVKIMIVYIPFEDVRPFWSFSALGDLADHRDQPVEVQDSFTLVLMGTPMWVGPASPNFNNKFNNKLTIFSTLTCHGFRLLFIYGTK